MWVLYFHSQSSVRVVKPLHPPRARGQVGAVTWVKSSFKRFRLKRWENLPNQGAPFILRLTVGVKYHAIQIPQPKDTGAWTERREDKRPYCKSCPRRSGRRREERSQTTIHPYLNLARFQKPEQRNPFAAVACEKGYSEHSEHERACCLLT